MAYQIATNETGTLYVVLTVAGKITRVVRKCENRADADQLLSDLSSWRF